jgi:hypothetical protein
MIEQMLCLQVLFGFIDIIHKQREMAAILVMRNLLSAPAK